MNKTYQRIKKSQKNPIKKKMKNIAFSYKVATHNEPLSYLQNVPLLSGETKEYLISAEQVSYNLQYRMSNIPKIKNLVNKVSDLNYTKKVLSDPIISNFINNSVKQSLTNQYNDLTGKSEFSIIVPKNLVIEAMSRVDSVCLIDLIFDKNTCVQFLPLAENTHCSNTTNVLQSPTESNLPPLISDSLTLPENFNIWNLHSTSIETLDKIISGENHFPDLNI